MSVRCLRLARFDRLFHTEYFAEKNEYFADSNVVRIGPAVIARRVFAELPAQS